MKLTMLLAAALFAAAPSRAENETHFSFTMTGQSAIVSIHASIAPTIDGVPIAVGDEIGAFTPAEVCVGAKTWTGENIAIQVWGYTATWGMKGIKPGEAIHYRAWQKAAEKEFPDVTVTYSYGNGIYADNAFFALASLAAVPSPPIAPVLISPADRQENVPTTAVLQWQASPDAVSYTIDVSVDSLFNNLVLHSHNAPTMDTVSSLAEDAVYYWRVQAVNAGGVSPWSRFQQFTTLSSVPPPLPGVPVCTMPLNNSVNVAAAPTMQWQTGGKASTFTLMVASDSLFTDIVLQSTMTKTAKTTQMLAQRTAYFWRVRSTNSTGSSAWSPTFRFTTEGPPFPAVPLVVYPTNGRNTIQSTALLQWLAAENAVSYGIELAFDSSFASILSRLRVYAAVTKTTPLLSGGLTYNWRVRSMNDTDTSAWSAVNSFTTVPSVPVQTPPGTTTIVSPSNGAENAPTSPYLRWLVVPGATSYNLALARDTAFTNVAYESSDTSTGRIIPQLSGGTAYYWRVQSVNGGGVSAWTAAYKFTTIVTPPPPLPGAPTLALPVNGAPNVARAAALQWNGVAEAAQYLLQIADDSLFEKIVERTLLTGTSWKLEPLVPGTVYYWRVRSQSSRGYSGFSQTFHFTVTSVLSVSPDKSGMPNTHVLEQNYPNPFNPSTTFSFSLPTRSYVSLTIFDVMGREIAVIVSGELSAGKHLYHWSAEGLPSGMYFYRLKAGTFTATRRLLLLQ